MKRLPIGVSDYKKLLDNNYYYIDKTMFIEEIWNRGGDTTLMPRPRRFGKTLNMSMLQYFFEKNYADPITRPHAYLFEDKKIWQNEPLRAKQGTYPVIFLTFKDIKELNWQNTYEKMTDEIAREYRRHKYLLSCNILDENEQKYFKEIMAKQAKETDYHASLVKLTDFLQRYHQSRVMVLLDEYDAPIHSAFIRGFYEEIINFTRGLLTGVFKDNKNLERGFITGILRASKEGIFSGLNNLEVFTILDNPVSDKFGFTQHEVDQLLADYNLSTIGDDFKSWYNGYLIGNVKMYNPWSVLHCAKKNGIFDTYWANTSDNALVSKIIVTANDKFKEQCTTLLSSNVLDEIDIRDKMVLPGMYQDANSIWNLLLFTGYVTIAKKTPGTRGGHLCSLTIPNRELNALFENTIIDLTTPNLSSSEIIYLEQALAQADGKAFEKLLSKFILQSVSSFDLPQPDTKQISEEDMPELSYHLFVLGILVLLGHRYAVRSNRESGMGRYDIMLIPLDKALPGIVIEFKKKDKDETMDECADRALEQIRTKEYVSELRSLGFTKIALFGIACFKKEVLLKQENL